MVNTSQTPPNQFNPTQSGNLLPELFDKIGHLVDFSAIAWAIIILFLIVYLIISAVVIKQIYLMTNTIKSSTNKMIIIMGYINFIVGLMVFFLMFLLR